MSHQADKSFFDKKREWSKRKDRILGSYLAAYLPKMATQGRPILIVDGFAGPGKFSDGNLGSPLIICKNVREAYEREKKLPVSTRVIAVEDDPELVSELARSLEGYDFAEARLNTFREIASEIVDLLKTYNAFVYIDPWAVSGLDWRAMERVFSRINRRVSVEVLLNFNAAAFVRRGLAALKLPEIPVDEAHEDPLPADRDTGKPVAIDKLHEIVGGDWWIDRIHKEDGFLNQVTAIVEGYCSQLARYFAEVGHHGLKAKPSHTIPKYYLIFASRHPDALRLMNDEMIKSRRTLAELAVPEQPTLFEVRSEELVPDLARLPSLVLAEAEKATPRGNVIIEVIRKNFCVYAVPEIRKAIEDLLKSGALTSKTGRTRINDATKIWLRG